MCGLAAIPGAGCPKLLPDCLLPHQARHEEAVATVTAEKAAAEESLAAAEATIAEREATIAGLHEEAAGLGEQLAAVQAQLGALGGDG